MLDPLLLLAAPDLTANSVRLAASVIDSDDLVAGAAIVQALCAAIIVVFTLIAVRHSSRMSDANKRLIEEAEYTRRQSVLPLMDIVIDPSIRQHDAQTREFRVDVTNHGLGPAVFIKSKWTPDADIDGIRCILAYDPDVLTLGPGQQFQLRFVTPWLPTPKPTNLEPKFRARYHGYVVLGHLRISYQDVYQRRGLVQREIDLVSRYSDHTVILMNDDSHEFEAPGLPPLTYD